MDRKDLLCYNFELIKFKILDSYNDESNDRIVGVDYVYSRM